MVRRIFALDFAVVKTKQKCLGDGGFVTYAMINNLTYHGGTKKSAHDSQIVI